MRFLRWLGCIAAASLIAASSDAEPLLSTPHYGTWGFDTSGMDRTVLPGDDFSRYANGAWARGAEVPADRTHVGYAAALDELSEARTRALLEALNSDRENSGGTAAAKVAHFYRSFMDHGTVEARGITPLSADLRQIQGVGTHADVIQLMGCHMTGFLPALFDLELRTSPDDPRRYGIFLSQGGLGLADPDYYLKPGFAAKKAAYRLYAARLLELAGWPNPREQAEAIVAFETRIAQVSWTRAEIRADDDNHRTTLAELKTTSPEFDWALFLRASGLGNATTVYAPASSSLPKIAAVFAATPVDTLKAWQAFRTVDNAAPYLPAAFVEARFAFRSRLLAGQQAMPPRWRMALTAMNGLMGDAIGRLYVSRYFQPETAASMADLVANLREAVGVRLDALTWMTPASKAAAQRKLVRLEVQIGHPAVWRDYSSLEVRARDLYGNIRRARAFDWQRRVALLAKPWDKSDWRFAPQEPTAYTENDQLIFPAAMLQPPFFDPRADPAINYGTIGAVIGHEITHGFDSAKDLSPAEAATFKRLAERLSRQFSAMEALPGLHVKGDLTLRENIADIGGLRIALDAYHASLAGKPAPIIDGFSGDQRVFFGWAQGWRVKYCDEALLGMVTSDPHSPPSVRVNGVVRNFDEWYSAFAVKAGSALYLAPEDRVRIW